MRAQRRAAKITTKFGSKEPSSGRSWIISLDMSTGMDAGFTSSRFLDDMVGEFLCGMS